MFKIHTNNGKTINVDPSDENGDWRKLLSNNEFQKSITAITIMRRCGVRTKCSGCGRAIKTICQHCRREHNPLKCNAGVQFSFVKPDLKEVEYQIASVKPNEASKMYGGEKLICDFEGFQIVLMSHANQPALKVSCKKIGKRRYNPLEERKE